MSNGNIGNAHIAFFVDELDPLYERLTALGVRSVSRPVTPTIGPNQGGRAVYLIDPDGFRVELIETKDLWRLPSRRGRRARRLPALPRTSPRRAGPPNDATKRVTIRDVAAWAGVDASLVSRVLNDHPKASAGPATRQRIVEAARKLGYHPNVAARSLRTAKTWTLGLLLPNLTNPMYAAIARAAERRAQERGYGLVFGTHVEGEDEATFARMMQQGRVDGLLTASSVLGDAFLRRFAMASKGRW